MFARYSRYPGRCAGCSWRSSPATCPPGERPFDGVEGERAAGLYERVFIGYGDDSIAQVGGAHVACEWVSNVLTKILQRGRLAAYLEQSTRYIPYDQPIEGTGGYRYYSDAELGPEYARGDGRAVRDLLAQPRDGPGVGGRALAARPGPARGRLARLDPGQGARPAARPAAGLDPQPRRHLRLRARPTSSCCCTSRPRRCRRRAPTASMLLAELQQVIPSFVARVEPPRPRRRLDRAPARAPRGHRARRRPARPRPARGRRRAVGRARPRRRLRGRPARRVAVRVGRDLREPRSAAGSPPSTRSSARS